MSNTLNVDVARTVGIGGVGLLAGAILATKTFMMPSLLSTPTLSPKDRLLFFNRLYVNGKNTIVPLALISATSLATAAYLSSTPLSPRLTSGFLSLVASNRRTTLAVSAALALAPLPYTLIFMLPGVSKLAEVEKKQAFGKEELESVDTDGLINKWIVQHNTRLALALSALVVASLEFISV